MLLPLHQSLGSGLIFGHVRWDGSAESIDLTTLPISTRISQVLALSRAGCSMSLVKPRRILGVLVALPLFKLFCFWPSDGSGCRARRTEALVRLAAAHLFTAPNLFTNTCEAVSQCLG